MSLLFVLCGVCSNENYFLTCKTIVKLYCQRQRQGSFFEKVVHQIQLQSMGETPNKEHLLQSNLLSNHIEVRLIIVCLSTELQDPKNNFPKENNP